MEHAQFNFPAKPGGNEKSLLSTHKESKAVNLTLLKTWESNSISNTVGGENGDLPHLVREYPSMDKQVTQLGFKFKDAEFSLSTYCQLLASYPDWSPMDQSGW